MAERRIGIIMHGATGRMGTTQHLSRALLAIRGEGGLALKNGDRLLPDPILVGRDGAKLAALAGALGVGRWTTDLDAALARKEDELFFDCAPTGLRPALVRRALEAGKHVHVEKPTAPTLAEAVDLARLAARLGRKNGVIQDKLFLPGLMKLKLLKDGGFFGRILAVRVEFGWWVFDGALQPSQRMSWNYRKRDGGGIALDMYSHWRYILDRLIAPVTRISAILKTHTPRRRDERGAAFEVDVDDAAYALLELEGGIVATVNSSWATRVRRDDLLTIQIDGTDGSAVAGLHRCRIQPMHATPKPPWNADVPQPMDFHAQWQEVPDNTAYPSSFRACWEGFLRHVAEDAPFVPTLLEGAKGVQLAELAERSSREGRWLEVPALTL
jgi:predicted dehydrogenase